MYKLAALYRFISIDSIPSTKRWLEEITSSLEIQGTLILAKEGLNGTVAGLPQNIDQCIMEIKKNNLFTDLDVKFSEADRHPFVRMNVKVKNEICTLGVGELAEPAVKVGEYVEWNEWNNIISDPEVLVIDTRNDYEVELGTFRGAVNPQMKVFREFPEYVKNNIDPAVNKKIAMFCTGGIRCEKASSFMLNSGFEKVYHLKGGILRYLEEMPKELKKRKQDDCGELDGSSSNSASTHPNESLWEGQCFVFDDRVSVGLGLEQGEYVLCRGCRHPLSLADRSLPSEQHKDGVYCRYCVGTLTDEQKNANLQRDRQMKIAQVRGEIHLGRKAGAPPIPN